MWTFDVKACNILSGKNINVTKNDILPRQVSRYESSRYVILF